MIKKKRGKIILIYTINNLWPNKYIYFILLIYNDINNFKSLRSMIKYISFTFI